MDNIYDGFGWDNLEGKIKGDFFVLRKWVGRREEDDGLAAFGWAERVIF